MELAFLVYLASIIGAVHSLFGNFSALSGVISVVLAIAMGVINVEGLDGYSQAYKWLKISLCSFLILSTLYVLTPKDEKTIYMMAGAYGVQTVATSDTAKKVMELIEIEVTEALDKAKAERKPTK